MEQAPSRVHGPNPQSGLSVGCKRCSSSTCALTQNMALVGFSESLAENEVCVVEAAKNQTGVESPS